MPHSRPTANELLSVVRDHLDSRIAPLLPSAEQFQLKMISRILATVEREGLLKFSADAAELKRLRELLQMDGTLSELNATLARAIRAGEQDIENPALIGHLRLSTEDALRINNPGWLAPSA